jgi:hypothetical protein
MSFAAREPYGPLGTASASACSRRLAAGTHIGCNYLKINYVERGNIDTIYVTFCVNQRILFVVTCFQCQKSLMSGGGEASLLIK